MKNWIIALGVIALGVVVGVGWLRREKAGLPPSRRRAPQSKESKLTGWKPRRQHFHRRRLAAGVGDEEVENLGKAQLLGRAVNPKDIDTRKRVGYMSQSFLSTGSLRCGKI